MRWNILSRLLQYHQTVVSGSRQLPDEMLYGRMGYLYALVFINQQLGQDRIPLQYIQQVGPNSRNNWTSTPLWSSDVLRFSFIS